MNPLVERAAETVDQAELYWSRKREIDVRYENFRLQNITQDDLSSVALRVIADGRFGTTYGVHPKQPNLLDDAMVAAAYGDPATFSFAPTAEYPAVQNHDERTSRMTSDDLVGICEAVKSRVANERSDIALFIQASCETSHLTIETTCGAEASDESTSLGVGFGAPIKGAGTGVYKSFASISPRGVDTDLIDEFLEWYGWTESTSTPSTGRLPVILAPEASFLLLLPLWAGLTGDAVEKGTSPLIGKLGEEILSEKLTVVDDPLRAGDPSARPFDDEGIPCRKRTLVEAGVLKDYLLDLRTAAALDRVSTGNARKQALFGGGTETAPNPWPINIAVESGSAKYRDLLSELDEGLLLTAGMGFHSGNYPQGHFAVQAVGYHIRGGRVIGRLDRTMVSGNIYKDFLNVRAVSSERRKTFGMLAGGLAPYILVDGLQVAGR